MSLKAPLSGAGGTIHRESDLWRRGPVEGVGLHGEALVRRGSELKFVVSFLESAAVRSRHRELSLYELQPLDHDAAVGLIDARFPALGPKVRQRVLAEAQGTRLRSWNCLPRPAALWPRPFTRSSTCGSTTT
jgi:hypothetical protein